MAKSDDPPRSGLADAAGRAAFFPARAAARVWRGPLEEAVDEVLSAPEITRVLDRALAGSLPEEIARSLVRHRVLERIAAELAASGELERLVTAALATPQDARAHRQGPRKRRDATRSAPRHLEPRAPRRDRPADDRARRGGGRAASARQRRAARRPGRAGRAPSRASRAPDLRRDRDARDRARDRRSPDRRHLHVDRRDRRARGVAGRGPPPGVARRRLARLRLAAGRGHVLRPLLERCGADTGDAAAPRCASSAPREDRSRSADRSCGWSGSCSRSCRCSPASSRCCSPSGDVGCRTSSPEPSSSTTTPAPRSAQRCAEVPASSRRGQAEHLRRSAERARVGDTLRTRRHSHGSGAHAS